MTDAPSCNYCRRPLEQCREPVDERFPQAAQDAYREAGYTTAATCDEGQRRDLMKVIDAQGHRWCWDRARFNRGWSGPALSIAERRGTGINTERMQGFDK